MTILASGSAYVFVRSGTSWTQQARLTACDAAEFDLFGFSVSIDGDTAVAGAIIDDDAGSALSTWRLSSETWAESAADVPMISGVRLL